MACSNKLEVDPKNTHRFVHRTSIRNRKDFTQTPIDHISIDLDYTLQQKKRLQKSGFRKATEMGVQQIGGGPQKHSRIVPTGPPWTKMIPPQNTHRTHISIDLDHTITAKRLQKSGFRKATGWHGSTMK